MIPQVHLGASGSIDFLGDISIEPMAIAASEEPFLAHLLDNAVQLWFSALESLEANGDLLHAPRQRFAQGADPPANKRVSVGLYLHSSVEVKHRDSDDQLAGV